MDFLLVSINFFLLLFGVLVLISENPVHSVLFLILTFCCAASILILFRIDFLALLFIIIYVGAIAILFLFVVMMLNVKIYLFTSYKYLSIFLICLSSISFQNFFILEELFSHSNHSYFSFDTFSNIDVFGQSLYNYYLTCFLLAGFILLVAMVGAIILTLNFSSHRKNELVFRQLSRSENFLSFFK